MSRPQHKVNIAKALGAKKRIFLTHRILQGPLDWSSIAREFETRLISHGGRPTDPRWDIQRLVPLNSKTWERLKKTAGKISVRGNRLSPAQLASVLIEKALNQLRT